MKIGIISEGHADRAVLLNVIIGITGLDSSDIEALRPIYNLDETDKAVLKPQNFSTWSVVKEECENKDLLEGFLAIEGQDFVAIHIDSAECDDYGVTRPRGSKSNNIYCEELRQAIIEQIKIWFNDPALSNQILHAIAIEEIDAWLLTIYDSAKSCSAAKPKEKLSRTLGKLGLNSTSNYENYLKLSKPFSKHKNLSKGLFLAQNCSLNAFCLEIIEKVKPKLERIA